MELKNNAILITGGATGIGYSMAKYFLEKGNRVLICGRREDRLAQAARELPGIQTIRCDVTSPEDHAALLAYVQSSFSNMNILVNNAGIQCDINLTKGLVDFKSSQSEIQINLEAPILISALFTPFLAGRENATIINVSSGLAFMPQYAVEMPVYCATKAGLHAFSIAQRKQLAPLGIRVIEIIPPMVESELNMASRIKRNMLQSPHMMSSDEFVEKVLVKMEQNLEEIRLER